MILTTLSFRPSPHKARYTNDLMQCFVFECPLLGVLSIGLLLLQENFYEDFGNMFGYGERTEQPKPMEKPKPTRGAGVRPGKQIAPARGSVTPIEEVYRDIENIRNTELNRRWVLVVD